MIQLTPVCGLKGESGIEYTHQDIIYAIYSRFIYILISDPIVSYHNEEENKIGLDCPEVFKRLQKNAAG